VHFIATRPLRQWPWIIAFGIFGALLFFLLYAQVVAVTHDWHWMSRLVQRRALSNQSDAHNTFGFWQWVDGALRHHAQRRHTVVAFILLAIWILLAITTWHGHPARALLRNQKNAGETPTPRDS